MARPPRWPRGSAPAPGSAAARSAASRLWLSARCASSSSPAMLIGCDRSPAETRSTARANPRSGAVRSSTSRYDPMIAMVTTMASANSSSRAIVGSSGPWTSTSTISSPTMQKTASGRIALASRASVSRVRKANRELRAGDRRGPARVQPARRRRCSPRTGPRATRGRASSTSRRSPRRTTDGGPQSPAGISTATSRYPTPRTVSRCTGLLGSSSSFWRSRRIVTQT